MPHPGAISGAESEGPRVVAWEITRRCPLSCRHCRGGAADCVYENELSTGECLRVLDSLAGFSRPMIIWTGGEPMNRPDIIQLVAAATERGLRSVMAPCGTLVTAESLRQLKAAGVMACSFSLDGATEAEHDAFRGVAGAYSNVTRAMSVARDLGMPFQVNCTVSKLNAGRLPAIRELAISLGAKTLDLFFLVPVGRGRDIADLAVDPETAEHLLRWAFTMDRAGPIRIRETCAPQGVRIWSGMGLEGQPPSGCMGGRGFTFISHTGILQPCGFLDIACADLRASDYDFKHAYLESPVFRDLRQPDRYGGHCGKCGFRTGCGGCRARAYSATGDYMAAEPGCILNREG